MIKAITFDLDDTLWPIWPAIERAEVKLHDWLMAHAAPVAAQFPPERMREIRAEVVAHGDAPLHDLRWVRRETIRTAFIRADVDEALATDAYRVFETTRSEIEFYPDALDGLRTIAERYPIASITNGSSDLERIGIAPLFTCSLWAYSFGVAKPDARIFHEACNRLGFAPAEVLHVGDSPEIDVIGARSAGMQSAWINRSGEAWPLEAPVGLEFPDVAHLAAWLANQAREYR